MTAPRLMPFFTYYGGKWRIAPKYPTPSRDLLIEPFAGSAGYSLRHPHLSVWLNDADPVVAGTWQYLVRVSEAEILALPDVRAGESVDDYPLCEEARWLIGWWLNKGSAQPKRSPSSFMNQHPKGGPYWGGRIRERIASQLRYIRHWRVTNHNYDDIPEWDATWFIDPPYVSAGKHYRMGSEGLNYSDLGQWCEARPGQVIVCEADNADWLPFWPLAAIDGTEGKQKTSRARMEVVCSWESADRRNAA